MSEHKSNIEAMLADLSTDKAGLRCLQESRTILDPRLTAVYPVLFKYLADKDLSITGEPTYTENAEFITAKMYAILKTPLSDSKSVDFFKALPHTSAINNRVNRLLQSMISFSATADGLIQIAYISKQTDFKTSINWTNLFWQLKKMQFSLDSARQVALQWSQDYFRRNSELKSEEN